LSMGHFESLGAQIRVGYETVNANAEHFAFWV
jgi:hypothetical protein